MRLDVFLRLSRLAPRRTVAQRLCEAGGVLVNNRVAKSAHSIKPNDVITIRRGKREMNVKVLNVSEQRQPSRKEASSLYELVSNHQLDEV